MAKQRWEIKFHVEADDSHRRAIAKKLGKRGLATLLDFEEVVLDLVEEWVADAFATEPVRMPRRKKARR